MIFSLLAPSIASSQSVGLVLSGGGAKGLYHIGVIRALEEHGIPIDCIAGTSIGAIVAALYAAGYSPDEMENIVLSGQPEKWVSGRIDDKYYYYYRDRDRMHGMLNIMLSTDRDMKLNSGRKRLNIPRSMINTSQIDMALLQLFKPASVACRGDFDKLMVPFRCMATDVNRHRAVELKSGDLALAVRASMAIPVVFPPVEIDSMILCDGGLYDNFPWRTLDNAFVILDEAQNTTLPQIKMFLTRMGRNAKFIVTGDVTQIDLPRRSDSGLMKAMATLEGIEGIGTVRFDRSDIVRHPLVRHIVDAFERRDKLENSLAEGNDEHKKY